MRKLFFFFIFICISALAKSQSTFHKSMDAAGLKTVLITLDNTFQIEVTNTSENKIIVSAVSEGEYQNNVLIQAKRTETTLTILDDTQPFSNKFDDKLSAHKLIALKVKIQLPQHLVITIKSKLASLELEARLKSLFVELNSGDCVLNQFIGNATINTLGGNIRLHTKNAAVKAQTKSGVLSIAKISGQHQITLKSISGNISVYKTK